MFYKEVILKIENIFSLSAQVVVITGAGGGLAAELIKALAASGATLVCVDQSRESMLPLQEELKTGGIEVLLQVCDVSEKKEIEAVIKAVHDKYKGIHVLVNCAGVLGADADCFSITEDDWDRVLDVNLKGSWLFATEVARYMREQKIAGSIVNISSSLGGRAQKRRVHYAASKAGVEHLTRNLAMELLPYGIRVNCLAPGWVATPMVNAILEGEDKEKWSRSIPMGRAAKAEELAGPLLLLASSASSYMTGSVLRVDGGYAYRGVELFGS